MRCRSCGRAVYEPDQHELAELPPKWLTLKQCPACILEPIDPNGDRSDPVHEARVRASGLPDRLQGLELGHLFDRPELKPAIAAARAWTLAGGGLFLHGPVGTGKTYIAAAAANEAMAIRPLAWKSVPQLVMAFRSQYDSHGYRAAADFISGGRGVVLDDLGQEAPSKANGELLFAVIDERLAQGLPVLITSNLLPSQLGERYGAWLPSRIAQMNPVRVAGSDLRLET